MSTIEQRAKTPLLILRVTLGLFLLQWGIEKFIMPDTSAMIFAGFYGIDGLSHTIAYVLGGLQCAVAVAVIAGFQKRISYLLAFLIHSVSTLSTIPNMLDPYSSGNHLFFTGVPVLAAMGLLWYLRDYDTKLSIDSMRKG